MLKEIFIPVSKISSLPYLNMKNYSTLNERIDFIHEYFSNIIYGVELNVTFNSDDHNVYEYYAFQKKLKKNGIYIPGKYMLNVKVDIIKENVDPLDYSDNSEVDIKVKFTPL